MEKAMTQRIVGVLAIFALIVILLPLLFNTNIAQSPLQTSEIKAPPFPQQQNVTSTFAALASKSAIPPSKTGEMIKKAVSSADRIAAANTKPVVNSLKVDLQPAIQQAAAAIAAKMNERNEIESIVAANTPKKYILASTTREEEAPVNTVPAAPAEDVVVIKMNGEATQLSEASMRDDLSQLNASTAQFNKKALASQKSEAVKLTKTAWVVQMGSFRDKNNAERLIKSLQAKGFKAFTFETKSNGQTRVYVGPELKQVAASSLANKIKAEMNMTGIVLNFKPAEA